MIDLTDITKIYSTGMVEVAALRGVSCRIEQGEMLAIMGPSGSGKSTLMNLLGLLDRPTSGTYVLEGRVVDNLDDDDLAEIRNKRLGFVFQSFNLLSRMTALANVELPLVYAGVADRRRHAMEALDRVGLAERATHRPNQLSGGEQQRVAIARAMVTRPALILADEPTGNLDTKTSAEVIALFTELNRDEGLTVILVTHEAAVAAQTRRIIRMQDGLIISDGPVGPNGNGSSA